MLLCGPPQGRSSSTGEPSGGSAARVRTPLALILQLQRLGRVLDGSTAQHTAPPRWRHNSGHHLLTIVVQPTFAIRGVSPMPTAPAQPCSTLLFRQWGTCCHCPAAAAPLGDESPPRPVAPSEACKPEPKSPSPSSVRPQSSRLGRRAPQDYRAQSGSRAERRMFGHRAVAGPALGHEGFGKHVEKADDGRPEGLDHLQGLDHLGARRRLFRARSLWQLVPWDLQPHMLGHRPRHRVRSQRAVNSAGRHTMHVLL